MAIAALVGAALVLLGAIPAGAASSPDRQVLEAELTSQRPGSATGLSFSVHYPDTEGGKPHAVRQVVNRLPRGARIDTAVPELCGAGDAELIVGGAEACPPGSRVGSGSLSVDFGTGPVDAEVTTLNNTGELILLVEPVAASGLARIVTRFEVDEGSITGNVPPLPGLPPPDSFMAIKDVLMELDRLSDGDRAYITTPPRCPRSGRWTFHARFTYSDGVEQLATSESPCTPPADALRLRLSVPAPQRSLRRVIARTTCRRVDCRAVARTRVRVKRPGRSARVFKGLVPTRRVELVAGEPRRLRAALPARVRRAGRAALRSGGRVSARIKVTARAVSDRGIPRVGIRRVRITRQPASP